jgi:DNA invertase Pin-like site-specific DNA recombinase
MTNYLYVHEESNNLKKHISILEKYMETHSLKIDRTIEDSVSTKVNWKERQIGAILDKGKAGDHIVVYEAAQLACSTSQVIEILSISSSRKVQLHFVKHAAYLKNADDLVNTQYLLDLISKIESDFISKRTTQALARRKAAGLPLGRPKGRGNKSLKLDKYKSDIKKYIALGISKASIAKLVNCHPQTLYDWLDRNNIKELAVVREVTSKRELA